MHIHHMLCQGLKKKPKITNIIDGQFVTVCHMNVFIVLLDIIDRVMECLGLYTGKIICGYVQIYIMCKQHMREKIYTSEK